MGRKAALVLGIIKDRATYADAAWPHGLTAADVESWVEKFMEGGRAWRRVDGAFAPIAGGTGDAVARVLGLK